MPTKNLTAALEALVDAHGVHAVLLDLAFICAEIGISKVSQARVADILRLAEMS